MGSDRKSVDTIGMRPNAAKWNAKFIAIAKSLAIAIAVVLCVALIRSEAADDEALIITPPGFTQPGEAKTASGANTARLKIIVHDRATGRPIPCRLNVVGPDGHFYQPAPNPLSPFSLTGQWPKTGNGNRKDTAPYRYLGRFFYTTGAIEVAVPAGDVRVEAWRGLEYRPVVKSIAAPASQTISVDLVLDRALAMAPLGYYSGDLHLHFPRKTEADDRVILDLLEAEDIQFGSILAYNEPRGPVSRADGNHGRASAPWTGQGLSDPPRRRPRSLRARNTAEPLTVT